MSHRAEVPNAALRRALRSVRSTVRRGSPAAGMEAVLGWPRPTAGLAMILFVRWAEEQCGASLAPARRSELEAVQAHLLAWGMLRDRIVDHQPGASSEARDVPRLLAEVHERLGRLLPPHSTFWKQFARLTREQAATDRWERTGRTRRFGPRLVERLGHKSALALWPAAAVAHLLGREGLTRRIERDFDQLVAAFQLLDDVIDAAEDAKIGQVNAVLAACPGGESAFELHARIAHGIPPVCAAARALLRPLSRRPGGLGSYSRWALSELDGDELRAMEVARGRGLASLFGGLLESARAMAGRAPLPIFAPAAKLAR